MSETPRCTQCGAELGPEAALDGQCLQCLLLLGIDDTDEEASAEGKSSEKRLGKPGAPTLRTPERVGPYRILERIGEGGMGVVYLAEQQEPIRRRVALKLIKLGMDTEQVIARFESERQALALMSHPNVAKVLDAGATAEGRPFFVMEYVAGIPITDYCDRYHLSLRERLELFLQACEAIQHAHQKGLIHRDIKPSNVLVTTEEDRPVVKVIDFGVAKATTQRLTERTLFTRHGILVGTPEYMSPEQAEGGGLDVDTRTDVYSLGVLLYVLMVGALPFDPEDLRRAGFDEIRRRIREEAPPRPSTRVSSLGPDSVSAAKNRRTDLTTLTRELQGDLDWIVMKALEKEPPRRYGSPSDLAAEIRRHLSDQPVLARPPSAVYRLHKLVRRHRLVFAATVLVVLALVGGAAVSTWQAVRATRAERLALEEAETARQVADFVVDLFELSDPGVARGESVTAREILERGRRRIEDGLRDRPLVRARMLAVIGEIYRKLGLYTDAAPLLEGALEVREELLGPGHPEVARSVLALARLEVDRGDDPAAEELFRRALELFTELHGPKHPETAEVVSDLADLARRQGHYEEAEEGHRAALAVREATLGPNHPETAVSWNGLGTVHARQGRYEEAVKAFRHALEIREKSLGEDHPEVAITLTVLASSLGRLGRFDEGEGLHQRAVEIFEKVYGPNHRLVASGLFNLGSNYGRQGRLGDAEAAFRRAAEIQERIFGPDHPEVSKVYKNLGQALLLEGRYDEAEGYFLRSLAIDQKTLDPQHFWVGASHTSLASVYRRQARWDEAEHHFRQGLEILEVAVGREHFEYLRGQQGLGWVALGRGRLEEAEDLFRRVLAGREQALGRDNPAVVSSLDALGETLRRQGRPAEAIPLHERGIEIRRQRLRTGHPGLGDGLVRLAEAHHALGNAAEAERFFREALAVWEQALGKEHPDVSRALHGLAGVLAENGDRQTALALYERALAIRRDRFPPGHPAVRETVTARAAVAESDGRL